MISIAILVKRWNGSENTERKGFVRSLLQSGNELQIHLGLQDLFKIADEQFKTIGLYSAEACPTEMLKSIYTNGVSLLKDYGKESFDGSDLTGLILEAKREIALYFINMFKAGHFEQLPLPEFGYKMPPATEQRVHMSKRNSDLNTLAYKTASKGSTLLDGSGSQIEIDENPGQGQEDPN